MLPAAPFPVEAAEVFRWDRENHGVCGPIVRVFCRRSHGRDRVQAAMQTLRTSLARELRCSPSMVFVQVVRVDDEEVLNVS